MGQTELTVFLTLAATFGQTGFLVGYQVSSSEHPFCLVRYLQEIHYILSDFSYKE